MRNRAGAALPAFLALYALPAWALAEPAAAVFAHLHIALDAGNAILSGLFALFLWGSAQAGKRPGGRRHLAVAFALVSSSELLHALIGAVQFPVLALLAAGAWAYRRRRDGDPLHRPLLACLALLFLSDLYMLWPGAPPDGAAMLAHAGKFLAYLLAHGAMLRLTLEDGRARDRAEAELQAAVATLRASERRFRQVLAFAPDAIVVSDAAGHIVMINRRTETLFGYAEAELLGQRIEVLVPRRSREFHAAQRQDFDTRPDHQGMEGRGRLAALARDGREFPVEISLSPLETEGGRIVISAIRDISRRKDLEQQIAERTADLLAANRELQAFTYAASHDIKAPLGRIASFSTLLQRKYRDRLEGDGLLFLDFIHSNTHRMLALIDDLLAHARIEQEGLNLKVVDLGAAARAALQEKQEDVEQGGAEVHFDLPPLPALADPQGLMQVLRNLLENALKYSAQSRPPRIEIGGAADDGACRLWVRDNGVGFDMAYHDRIFEIFRRLHTYEEFPGSGVGLALVRKAMERMGGKVWAESAPGAGAAFFLELPLAEEAAAPDRPAASA